MESAASGDESLPDESNGRRRDGQAAREERFAKGTERWAFLRRLSDARDLLTEIDRILRDVDRLCESSSLGSRDADACLATRSAAQTFGLDFIPLRSERYDLVMRKRTADLPAVKAFLDVLQRATLRRKLEVLAGYDTSETGTLVA